MHNISLYVHIPFCQTRCSYCDFYSTAGREGDISAYVHALCMEVEKFATSCPEKLPVHTLFIGGGTPSIVPLKYFDLLISAFRRNFTLLPDMELTLEANPGTVSLDYLKGLHQLGFNRISLGMQSSDSHELRILGRRHDFIDVVNAVNWARQAAFDNLSLDLIYGLPAQGQDSWKRSLESAVNLNPEHLSLYALSIESGTRFSDWAVRGLINIPDDDVAADMYEYAMEYLDMKGYAQYEISNWEKWHNSSESHACIHNLQYWRNLPYIGFGAAAHGSISNHRLENVADIDEYIRLVNGSSPMDFPFSTATAGSININRQIEMEETMMVGLRLTREGVSQRNFQARFGEPLLSRFNAEISYLLAAGLLEKFGEENDGFRLTRRGRLLGNQVFMQFVGE